MNITSKEAPQPFHPPLTAPKQQTLRFLFTLGCPPYLDVLLKTQHTSVARQGRMFQQLMGKAASPFLKCLNGGGYPEIYLL